MYGFACTHEHKTLHMNTKLKSEVCTQSLASIQIYLQTKVRHSVIFEVDQDFAKGVTADHTTGAVRDIRSPKQV